MTFEVQQTRWDRIIRRVSGSIGPGSRVGETLSELFPVLDVERVPAELLLLGGTRLAMGSLRVVAAGANFAQVMLRNPGGSGQLITVTEVRISSPTSQRFVIGPTQNTFTVPGNQAIADTREFPNDPTGQVLGDALLVFGASFWQPFLLDQEIVVQPPDALAVLAPGTALSVSASVSTSDVTVSFLWRERSAEESELRIG